jgi:hypothetical protein
MKGTSSRLTLSLVAAWVAPVATVVVSKSPQAGESWAGRRYTEERHDLASVRPHR